MTKIITRKFGNFKERQHRFQLPYQGDLCPSRIEITMDTFKLENVHRNPIVLEVYYKTPHMVYIIEFDYLTLNTLYSRDAKNNPNRLHLPIKDVFYPESHPSSPRIFEFLLKGVDGVINVNFIYNGKVPS